MPHKGERMGHKLRSASDPLLPFVRGRNRPEAAGLCVAFIG